MKRHAARILPLVGGLALVVYFAFHAAYGDRGIVAYRDLEQSIADRQAQLAALEARKAVIARRVRLVSGPEIDGDILEEEVRQLLGWTRPDEIVILAPHGGRTPVN